MAKIYDLVPKEDNECMALMEWAHYHSICKKYLIHIANEGKRTPQYGHKLKKMGLKKGVSDYFLAYPHNGYAGLWIELKAHALSRSTPEQIEWIEDMKSVGYQGYIVYDWERAKDLILDYLK